MNASGFVFGAKMYWVYIKASKKAACVGGLNDVMERFSNNKLRETRKSNIIIGAVI